MRRFFTFACVLTIAIEAALCSAAGADSTKQVTVTGKPSVAGGVMTVYDSGSKATCALTFTTVQDTSLMFASSATFTGAETITSAGACTIAVTKTTVNAANTPAPTASPNPAGAPPKAPATPATSATPAASKIQTAATTAPCLPLTGVLYVNRFADPKAPSVKVFNNMGVALDGDAKAAVGASYGIKDGSLTDSQGKVIEFKTDTTYDNARVQFVGACKGQKPVQGSIVRL